MGEPNGRTDTSRWKRGLQIAIASVVVFIGAYAVGTAVAGPFFWYSCSLNGLEAHGTSQASVILARDGTRLGMLGSSGSRSPVALQKISPVLRKAIIDTEDSRFYSNNGIDYIGILRALKTDVSSGQFSQGASTIEQQLVRNLYLTPQQTLGRKIKEACLAVELDRHWSKDRILTARRHLQEEAVHHGEDHDHQDDDGSHDDAPDHDDAPRHDNAPVADDDRATTDNHRTAPYDDGASAHHDQRRYNQRTLRSAPEEPGAPPDSPTAGRVWWASKRLACARASSPTTRPRRRALRRPSARSASAAATPCAAS